MSGATYVRFYASDWRSGCIGLTLEQEGFYVRVCAYIYETGLRLSLDDKKAAKFLGVHTNAYRRYRDQLADLRKLVKTDDGWTVIRVEKELKAALGAARRSDGATLEDGRIAVEEVADSLPDTIANTPHNTHPNTPPDISKTQSKINGHLKSQEPVPKKEKNPPLSPRDRGARLGDDWQLPEEWRDWVRINFASASLEQIDDQAARFADYWHAIPGAKGRKANWQATWRNWCRNAFTPGRNSKPMNWGRNAYDESKARSSLDAIVNGGWG